MNVLENTSKKTPKITFLEREQNKLLRRTKTGFYLTMVTIVVSLLTIHRMSVSASRLDKIDENLNHAQTQAPQSAAQHYLPYCQYKQNTQIDKSIKK